MYSRVTGFTSRHASDCLDVLEIVAGIESEVLRSYFFAPSLQLIFY